MRSRIFLAVLLFACITVSACFAQRDEPGSKDYPGITRMPGFFITSYQESEFDGFNFPVMEKGNETEQRIEGRYFKINYERPDSGAEVSKLQILRNMQNAARALGGQMLEEQVGDPGYVATTLRLHKDGKDVWIRIGARTNQYEQIVVETQTMQQQVVMDAAAMGAGLAEAGRVAVYGIYFDTAKSDLKPESEPALVEIGKLLKQRPALKVYIVGHTDMVGDPTANLKLSQARAQAVVAALVTKHGVANSRLIPFGNGPYAPVASNKTDEGRAKNRRVELVEIATQ